jgi:hypothetical protein
LRCGGGGVGGGGWGIWWWRRRWWTSDARWLGIRVILWGRRQIVWSGDLRTTVTTEAALIPDVTIPGQGKGGGRRRLTHSGREGEVGGAASVGKRNSFRVCSSLLGSSGSAAGLKLHHLGSQAKSLHGLGPNGPQAGSLGHGP